MRFAILLLLSGIFATADEVDRIVREEMARQHIPGASIAVLRDGRIVKVQGYGVANLELNTPANAESVYRIGSVSKQFIAAGILLLQQDGKLSVDDKIGRFLEDAPAAWSGITLRHLMSHTSGIVREGPAFSPLRVQPDIDVVRSAYPLPLAFPTGEKWQYCNVCYFALAEVVSRVSGKPWPRFLNDRVFVPLGMNSTRTTTNDNLVPNRAGGYSWENGLFRNAPSLLAVRPSGALLSNVIDLAKWDAALYATSPLTEATRQLSWTKIRLNNGKTYDYGLGWTVEDFDGRRVVGHGGALSGFKSHFLRFLDDRLSVIVLVNENQATPEPIARRIAAVYLGATSRETALDRYVAQKDPVYGWKLVNKLQGEGYQSFVLELTSQSWRKAAEVDRPVWKHWLTITRPDRVVSNKALLFIGGGANGDPAPLKPSERAARMAVETGTVVADLGMVPNQPLRFTDSPDKPRSEDDLIAYTRVKHFSTKDDSWLVRLAMVKSGVRAMDAMQEFLRTPAGGRVAVDQFVVAGGSKRGWTSWLVGAVDPRVVAIMPIVIDALNSEAITRHHFEVLGFFSPALKDYVNHGLFPHKIGTPEYRAVLDIEDPFNYRDRPALRMPKFLMNASGDQFFLPDNSQFYYSEVSGEKHLRYVPNAKHNLAGSDSLESLLSFYQSVVLGTPRPRFDWKKESDGSLKVTAQDRPLEVKLWQATNPEARDFRVDTIGNAYTSTILLPGSDGVYTGKVAKPAKGYTAFFVEVTFPGPGKYPFKFTTGVSVVPDVLPHQWSEAAAKYGGR